MLPLARENLDSDEAESVILSTSSTQLIDPPPHSRHSACGPVIKVREYRLMSATQCQQCGRPNGASATSCIWCGAPMGSAQAFQKIRVELGYVEGIERFEDAAPVRLTVDLDGVEVTEIMPGTRSQRIPVESIVEANVRVSGRQQESSGDKSGWWRRGSSRAKERAYILTVRFRSDDAVSDAVFQREDDEGFTAIQSLARAIRLIVRLRGS
jgi:HSP20 family molecular chaperone IbpA